MRVPKTYRLSSKIIMKIEVLSEKLESSSTDIIEKAIEEFYNKQIKGIQCIPIDKYNELITQLQEANKVILELNNQIQSLTNQIKQLDYDKVSLEFKLKEKEDKIKKLKEKMEKVPFWRKDLGEILGKDIKDLFKPKKEEEED